MSFMFRYLAATAAATGIWLLAGTAASQSITYYVQSAPYSTVGNYTACPVGSCTATYTTSQRLSGSFTILGSLNPNLVDEVVDVRLGNLNLSDGQNTFQSDFSTFIIVPQTAQISTDGSGNLTFFEFKFDKINGTPIATGAPANPKSYVSSIILSNTPGGGNFASVRTNSLCTARGDNTGGNTLGRGCSTQTTSASQGGSQAFATSVTISLTPPPPPPIPTLSEWAMIMLGVLLAGGAAVSLQRRRQAA